MLEQTLTVKILISFNFLPQYLEMNNYKYEIIIVNDASTDKTSETALKYALFKNKKIDLKIVEYKTNKGKGGAVRYVFIKDNRIGNAYS